MVVTSRGKADLNKFKLSMLRYIINRLRTGIKGYNRGTEESDIPEANLYFAIFEQAFIDLLLIDRQYKGREQHSKNVNSINCAVEAFKFLTETPRHFQYSQQLGLPSDVIRKYAVKVWEFAE